MNKSIRHILAAAILLFTICLSGCGGRAKEISLGEDLPVWKVSVPRSSENADIQVYRFPRENGISPEEFGQQQASEREVFCNMLTYQDVPAAVLNYYECAEGGHFIVQAYIFETDTEFVEVCTMFKTEPVAIGSGDFFIRMICEYEAQEQRNSPLAFDTVYVTDQERLPELHIKELSKEEDIAIIEPDLPKYSSVSPYSTFAENEWTLEEFVSLYSKNYDLLKGEVIKRNSLDLAFIGYIDKDVFKTRAFIDAGENYIMLCAEAETSRFQHVTNALIDTIGKNGCK